MFELNIPKIKKSKIKVLSLRRKAFLTKKGVARITNIMNKPIREPISIKLRKKVLERAKGKCEKCRKIKNSDVRLNFHHKNMINDDNRLSNIRALCPNCHAKVHKENKVIYISNGSFGLCGN